MSLFQPNVGFNKLKFFHSFESQTDHILQQYKVITKWKEIVDSGGSVCIYWFEYVKIGVVDSILMKSEWSVRYAEATNFI